MKMTPAQIAEAQRLARVVEAAMENHETEQRVTPKVGERVN